MGAIELPDDGMLWRIWAPRAQHAELALFTGEKPQLHPMQREEQGFFFFQQSHVEQGQRYAVRIDKGPLRPDPCSLWQPEGIHAPSAVFRPSQFPWTDQTWGGVKRRDLVIYELHVGTFTPEGTFAAIIPRLDELRELGITAIELMPVAAFPGERNWGYDGVCLYAAQHSYGGPYQLQKLVDACHAAGLAIFLDVVYNHAGPEGNYLAEFGPYFTDRYRNVWGPAFNFDDSGSDTVRDYVLDNARMWLEEFHFDGLRLDSVHAILDMSARHLLRSLQEVADDAEARLHRPFHIMAESDMNAPRFLEPPAKGGYGLEMQWSDDFHHAVHAYMTGERDGYYSDYGTAEQIAEVFEQPFLYAGSYSHFRDRRHGAPANGLASDRFIVAMQNHDQIGNRAHGERLSVLVCPARNRLIASLLCLAPHVPLIFMGEEYGEENPFLFFCSFGDERLRTAVREGRQLEFAAFHWKGKVADPEDPQTFERSKLSWSWPVGSVRAGIRRLYHDLLFARRGWPSLRNFDDRRAFYLPGQHGDILRLLRGGRDYEFGKTIEAVFNLTGQTQQLTNLPHAPQVRLFSSESVRYGGAEHTPHGEGQLLPYECVVYGPPNWPKFVL